LAKSLSTLLIESKQEKISKELLNIYKEKELKGKNLLCGLFTISCLSLIALFEFIILRLSFFISEHTVSGTSSERYGIRLLFRFVSPHSSQDLD
jgi:hypothetical protein